MSENSLEYCFAALPGKPSSGVSRDSFARGPSEEQHFGKERLSQEIFPAVNAYSPHRPSDLSLQTPVSGEKFATNPREADLFFRTRISKICPAAAANICHPTYAGFCTTVLFIMPLLAGLAATFARTLRLLRLTWTLLFPSRPTR